MKEQTQKVLPVFLDHEGCGFRCGFCNQRISVGKLADAETQIAEVCRSLAGKSEPQVQLAFYGGDFLRIPPQRQKALIDLVAKEDKGGAVVSLRASVRPDSVTRENLDRLRTWGFSTIEIGVQCLDDSVLSGINRGHNTESVMQALRLCRESGLRVGVQLMVGLPGQTREMIAETDRKIALAGADFVRIFPAVALRKTDLEKLYREGRFVPLTLEEAIAVCAKSLAWYENRNIPVIQIGLHPSEAIVDPESVVAGPFHAAMGELVRGRLACLAALWAASQMENRPIERVMVHDSEISLLLGHGAAGLQFLRDQLRFPALSAVADPKVPKEHIRVEYDRGAMTVAVDSVWKRVFAQTRELG